MQQCEWTRTQLCVGSVCGWGSKQKEPNTSAKANTENIYVDQVDERTGMVMNISDLKMIIDQRVLIVLDHKNLDLDVPHFRDGPPSTTENLSVFIWHELRPELPKHLLLTVKIMETEKNWVIYRGPSMM
eukprot:c835_g1_i2.p1 GENE.c835_g1_i2~~c835_g1_i2.p1  ORF type:complete len:129 (+),score=18.53 c835_g1_i2:114-500(+)